MFASCQIYGDPLITKNPIFDSSVHRILSLLSLRSEEMRKGEILFHSTVRNAILLSEYRNYSFIVCINIMKEFDL